MSFPPNPQFPPGPGFFPGGPAPTGSSTPSPFGPPPLGPPPSAPLHPQGPPPTQPWPAGPASQPPVQQPSMLQQPPMPAPPFPQPPKKSRKGLWASLTVVAVGLVAVLGIGGFVIFGPGFSDSGKVKKTVDEFAAAVDTSNAPAMLALMCTAQAQQLRDTEGFDADDDSTVDPGSRRPVNISDIRIDGDTAQVTVTRPPEQPNQFTLVKEDGRWKMCTSGPADE